MASRRLRLLVAGIALAGTAAVAVSVAEGGIDATVTGKATDAHGSYVIATTDVGGLEFQRYLPAHNWAEVQEGDQVVYHVHTGETAIYTWERGSLIWRG